MKKTFFTKDCSGSSYNFELNDFMFEDSVLGNCLADPIGPGSYKQHCTEEGIQVTKFSDRQCDVPSKKVIVKFGKCYSFGGYSEIFE